MVQVMVGKGEKMIASGPIGEEMIDNLLAEGSEQAAVAARMLATGVGELLEKFCQAELQRDTHPMWLCNAITQIAGGFVGSMIGSFSEPRADTELIESYSGRFISAMRTVIPIARESAE